MTKNKFYSIWDGNGHGTMTRLLINYGFLEANTPEEADFLVFNGGADIATEIYDEVPVMRGIPEEIQPRDLEEISLYRKFVGKLPFIGICRGAQLLNCLNGGSLWQHVTDHQVDHKMTDLRTGESFFVTSTHHQMMRPTKKAEIIGVSQEARRKYSDKDTWERAGAKTVEDQDDIEAVYYADTRSLCIQGHPEYVPNSDFANWSIKLLNEKIAA